MSISRPKLVVLDGQTLNPGDLSWAPLGELGELTVYDRTPPELVVERAHGAEVIFTNKTLVPANAILALPGLRYIGVLATGYNVVDVAAARARGIVVTNVPDYATQAVAQATFALILELAFHVGHHASLVRNGGWTSSPDFCFWDRPLRDLTGATLGLLGFGRIGQAVARIGAAMGMRVIVASRRPRPESDGGPRSVGVEELFRESDVLSLHCPLTPETKGIVNAQHLALMKTTSWIVNTGRGALVDEAALAQALREGRIAGAAVDVLSTEPPTADNPLLSAPNCYITPHIAWAADAARKRLMEIAVANARAFLVDGKPVNTVQ